MKAPGILNLIGGIICLIYSAFWALLGSVASAVPVAGAFIGAAFWVYALWGFIVSILLIMSAVKYQKSRSWGIIGMVFSILGLVTLVGLVIGPLLGVIGSALALEGKKK